jgi:hypothetical protein
VSLAGATPAAGGAAADPQAIAHQILTEDRFRPAPLPRPLHGVLDALGGAITPIVNAVDDAFSAVAALLPGGSATLWVLLGGAILALAAVVTRGMTDRTLADRATTRARRDGGPAPPDARALEAAAEQAERDGRLEQAVRLRFQAGLLRLDELGVLSYRPSLANAAVSRRLGSPIFDGLARRFEEVAYGGQPAEPGDVGSARDGWRRVLAGAGRR